MARSKAFGAFADSFSRSFGMGANIAMQQKRLGEEYAWRQQQETTRKQELQDRIKRQDKIRAEDLTYRTERDTKADTRYQEGLEQRKEDRKETSKQRYLDRQSREKIAGMRQSAGMDRWRVVLEKGRKHFDIAQKYITEQLGNEPAAFSALQILNGEMAKLKNQKKVSREKMSRARDMLVEALGGDEADARRDADRILGIETLVEFME